MREDFNGSIKNVIFLNNSIKRYRYALVMCDESKS